MTWRGLAAAAAAVGVLCSVPAAAAPAMWVVRDADSEIFLFGTLHALAPDAAWRTPAYDAAYRKADAVWFEAEADELHPAALRALIARYGVDEQRPLSARLGRRQLADLKAVLAQDGGRITLAQINRLRPWAAALALSMQPAASRGATVENGADVTVTRQARQTAKPIRAFETLEDQVKMFASLPEAVELKYLTDVIAERRGRRPPAGSLSQAWMTGDVEQLGAGVVRDMQSRSPGFYDALLKRRNEAWAEALSAQMSGQGVELVNVGALHMLGEDGLPSLMKARGYHVERVQ